MEANLLIEHLKGEIFNYQIVIASLSSAVVFLFAYQEKLRRSFNKHHDSTVEKLLKELKEERTENKQEIKQFLGGISSLVGSLDVLSENIKLCDHNNKPKN